MGSVFCEFKSCSTCFRGLSLLTCGTMLLLSSSRPSQHSQQICHFSLGHWQLNWPFQKLIVFGKPRMAEGGSSLHVVRQSSVQAVKRSFVHVVFYGLFRTHGIYSKSAWTSVHVLIKKSCFAWVLPHIRSRKCVRVGLKSRRFAVRLLSSQRRMIPAVIQLDQSNDLDSLFGHRMIPQVNLVCILGLTSGLVSSVKSRCVHEGCFDDHTVRYCKLCDST